MVSRNIFSKMYLPKVVFGHLFLSFFQNPKKVLEKKVNYFTYSIYQKGLKTGPHEKRRPQKGRPFSYIHYIHYVGFIHSFARIRLVS
jgi:hypothetical protein